MVERIRELLQARQLTPTQFADAIGVARPIVSHILSGRNKPSLEVVQKIIAAFPDLSLPWLLSGTGTMLAGSGPSSAATPLEDPLKALNTPEPPAPVRRPRATTPLNSPTTHRSNPAPVAAAVAEAPEPAVVRPAVDAPGILSDQVPEVVPTGIAPVAAAASSLPLTAGEYVPAKKIRRIVVFYQDGTFTDYQPE
jgi:transcriptional regulator with XRE-family HTH domain